MFDARAISHEVRESVEEILKAKESSFEAKVCFFWIISERLAIHLICIMIKSMKTKYYHSRHCRVMEPISLYVNQNYNTANPTITETFFCSNYYIQLDLLYRSFSLSILFTERKTGIPSGRSSGRVVQSQRPILKSHRENSTSREGTSWPAKVWSFSLKNWFGLTLTLFYLQVLDEVKIFDIFMVLDLLE